MSKATKRVGIRSHTALVLSQAAEFLQKPLWWAYNEKLEHHLPTYSVDAFLEAYSVWNYDRQQSIGRRRERKSWKELKESRTAAHKQWWEDRRKTEKYKTRRREYRIANREKINAYHRNRRKRDLNYRITCYLRARLRKILTLTLSPKKESSLMLIGGSLELVRKYLEARFKPGMSWDNYGQWHIDHVHPVSLFDLTKLSEQRKCFHYSNLQPLWGTDNCSKGNRIIKQQNLFEP